MNPSDVLTDAPEATGLKRAPQRTSDPATRLPPHSPAAERGVLACILLDHEEAAPVVIARIPAAADFFYDLRHRTIYKAVAELATACTPIDLVTLGQRLRDSGQVEEAGGLSYLASLSGAAPSAANLSYYLDILIEQTLLRRVIRVCSRATAAAYDKPDNVDEALDAIERDILSIVRERTDPADCSMPALVKKAVSTLETWHAEGGASTGLLTGFTDLDRMTHGFNPGDMAVIAARPSMGKTSLAMNIAEYAAIEKRRPVGVFSLEMTADSLARRMLCSRARVNEHEVRHGILAPPNFARITAAAADMIQAPIFIDDTPGLDILGLRARARRMAHQHKTELFIVDYLQLLRSTAQRAENRQQEIAEISGSLKSLAKELAVPVIVLSQLNREVEARQGKPRLSNLRESGAIEQDADFVGLLYTPANKESEPDKADHYPVNLLIAKQRNGPTGDIPLIFLKCFTRFESAAKVSDEDIPTGS